MMENIVAYGTFITRRKYVDFIDSVNVVRINGFRRIFNPKIAWFPFVIPESDCSFLGISFRVDDNTLQQFDYYEGCEKNFETSEISEGLYYRKKIRCELVNKEHCDNEIEGWIYLPTKKTFEKYNLDEIDDGHDSFYWSKIKTDLHLYDDMPDLFVDIIHFKS